MKIETVNIGIGGKFKSHDVALYFESIGDERFLKGTLNLQMKGGVFAFEVKVASGFFLLSFQHHGKSAVLNLKELAGHFLDDVNMLAAIPELEIDIKNAFILYQRSKQGEGGIFALGVRIDSAPIKLPLPQFIPMTATVAVQDFLIGYSSRPIQLTKRKKGGAQLTKVEKDRNLINRRILKDIGLLELKEGINFGAILDLNGEKFALGDAKPVTSQPHQVGAGERGKEVADPEVEEVEEQEEKEEKKSGILDKKLGPLSLHRLAFAFDKKLNLILEASFAMAGLEVSLSGFVLEFDFKDLKNPTYKLAGLGISFKKGDIEIAGMLAKVDRADRSEFVGGVRIKMSKFTINGIGAYSRVNNEHSLFIYANYNGPIGGPTFFFVTGVAFGFGINRKLRLPSLDQVPTFPLVSVVMDTSRDKGLTGVIADLIAEDWIPASQGDYWLALGVRFTSFNIIDSFLLMTVQFGTRTEFALIGLSRILWPKDDPQLYIELAIMANYAPGTGLLKVEGQLNNSYIFDKNCKLSGGFAYYAWLSGEHEGDFVVSVGGYHPNFRVPAHYPKVERLALSWKLGDAVSIYGDMYFALTPQAIMAGGKWEVEFNMGFLRASVLIWANILIGWAPFYYEIDCGIIVKIEATIKIWFVKVNFKLQLGAQVHIWGPPFSGEIKVDWSVFSFTIPFGESNKKKPEGLDWPAFETQFVPKGKVVTLKLAAGVSSASTPDSSNGAEMLLVNPNDLVLYAESFFPLTELPDLNRTYVQLAADSNGISKLKEGAQYSKKPLRIKPLKNSPLLNTKPRLTIKREGGKEETWDQWYAAKGGPKALWGKPDNEDTEDKDTGVLKDLICGVYARPPLLPEGKYEKSTTAIENIDRDAIVLKEAKKNVVFEQIDPNPAFGPYTALMENFGEWKFPTPATAQSHPR